MNQLILTTAARTLLPVFVVLSLLVLWRGHNLPGGGFIGGLLAASAFALLALAEGVDAARRHLRFEPLSLLATGLLLAGLSGFLGLFFGAPFLTGYWLPTFELPLMGTIHLGTPLLFDLGVYLTVIGFTLKTAFILAEAD